MLFWLCVIVMVAGIVLLVLNETCGWFAAWAEVTGWISTLGGGIVATIMLIVIIGNLAIVTGNVARHQETYKALIYKQQTEACRDEFGLLNKEYIDEVQKWNEAVVTNKAYHNSFWIGIFNPDTYKDVDVIDLENITFKQ